MDTHEAQGSDGPAIRDVARRSLQASYSLGPKAITGAIEEWYNQDRLAETLSADDRLLLVASEDDQVVGFSESVHSEDTPGTLLWLHVDPDYRGHGIASALFDTTCDRLHDHGVDHVRGRVLTDNTEGTGFYEDRGFEKVGTGEVEIDGRTYTENIYSESGQAGYEPIDVDSQTAYIDHDSHEPGSFAPFHVIFTDEGGEDRYGYFCSNCDTLANGMDSMGRIECDTCGNTRKPVRWDSAYL